MYICVPPFAHGPPERAAIDAGLPFFVEKPLAVDLVTAEAIATAVADHGLVTAAGYQWRYLDTLERAQELLAGNPARLALTYWLDAVPPPPWWVHRSLSGGQIVEQATHALDLARVLVGEVVHVQAVSARTERAAFPRADVDDVAAATLRFQTGAVGSISSTCLLSWKHRAGIHLVCEGMVIELAEPEMAVHLGDGPAKNGDHGGHHEQPSWHRRPLPTPAAGRDQAPESPIGLPGRATARGHRPGGRRSRRASFNGASLLESGSGCGAYAGGKANHQRQQVITSPAHTSSPGQAEEEQELSVHSNQGWPGEAACTAMATAGNAMA